MEISDERMAIIKQVLTRMDEICPADDINVVEGELVDALLDDGLLQFLRIANVDTLAALTMEVDTSGMTDTERVLSVTLPAGFIRLSSVKCGRWRRGMYESDLMTTSSMAWKMASMPFHEPTPLKPLIAIEPKTVTMETNPDETETQKVERACNVLYVAPCRKGDEVIVRYVGEMTAEGFAARYNKDEDGHAKSVWYAYIWFMAYLVLQAMGQADTSATALQHMQAFQAIPNGMPIPAPAK